MNKQYLEEVINGFVLKDKRNRFIELLGSKRRYKDFLDNLLRDTRYLDPKCIIEIPGNEQIPENIYEKLQEFGARKECYVVSLDLEQDGLSVNLKSALSNIVGSMSETLLYCPEGRVGYYEGHEGWRYILRSSSK